MYPPVGPKSLPTPAVKPVKTGTPTNPKRRYKRQLTVPQSHPLTYTAKNIPKIPSDIGTGLIGRTIERGPKMHIIAVERATFVIVIVFIFVFLFMSFPFSVYNFKFGVYNTVIVSSTRLPKKFTIGKN